MVYTFWSVVPPVIHIPSYQSSIRYTYIMAIDTNEEVWIKSRLISFIFPRVNNWGWVQITNQKSQSQKSSSLQGSPGIFLVSVMLLSSHIPL